MHTLPTTMLAALALAASLSAVLPAPLHAQGGRAAPVERPFGPRVQANDNRVPGGVLRRGTLKMHLVAQRASWYPAAEDGAVKVVETLAEKGHSPQIPAPLIRVPLGTRLEVKITNSLADTLVVLGLGGRTDSLRLAPRQTRTARMTASAVGSYMYRAALLREGEVTTDGSAGQMVGGFIVDSGAPPNDRTFITTSWGTGPFFMAVNGKSFPYTEKFVQTVGDTVRWRVLNSANDEGGHHPMHLHGFYYEVTSRGGWGADTVYTSAERRSVVTENVPPLGSMTMTWVPARPGNWLFHCHNAEHVAGHHRHAIASTPRPWPPITTHDASEHMAQDMSGIVNTIEVLPRGGGAVTAEPDAQNPRKLRLLIQERAGVHGNGPRGAGYGFVLQDGAVEPAADSITIPGSRLVLQRDEPVEITVLNRLGTHTAVHWHGIELESFYDGIAGWSGAGNRIAPMIAPHDSFIVRFTPPRAGTFIYHAHITDVEQIARGLYGALVVVPPGYRGVPGTDHVAIVAFGRPGGKASLVVNGSRTPAPLDRLRDGVQRIRIINISTENNAIVTLSDGMGLITWRAVAKDGFDLPLSQRSVGPAHVRIFPGETYDFEFDSRADVLRLLASNTHIADGDEDIPLELRVRP
ncbi:MAG: multicopper oxidase domain-containing protein [Gemmatimonadales bacterium]